MSRGIIIIITTKRRMDEREITVMNIKCVVERISVCLVTGKIYI